MWITIKIRVSDPGGSSTGSGPDLRKKTAPESAKKKKGSFGENKFDPDPTLWNFIKINILAWI